MTHLSLTRYFSKHRMLSRFITYLKENKQVLVFAVVCFALILNLFHSNPFAVLFAFLITLAYVIIEKQTINVFCLLFALISFNYIFKISPSSFSLFSLLELLTLLVVFLKNNYFKTIDSVIVFLSFALVLFIIFVDAFHSHFNLNEYIRQFVNIFVLYCVLRNTGNDLNTTKIIKYFAVGIIVSSLIGLNAAKLPLFYDYIRHVGLNAEVETRFSGMTGDPNYYSVSVIICLVGLMYLFVKKKIGLFFWISFVALSYFGLLTLSKSFLLTWSAVCFYFLILLISNKMYPAFWASIILLSLSVLVLLLQNNFYLTTIFNRLSDASNVDDLTSGRTHLWSTYLNAVFKDAHFIFGYGITAPDVNSRDVHNFFIELIYYLGFVGAFFYFSVYFYIFISFKKVRHSKIGDFFGFLILAIMYFFLQMVHFNELPFHLSIAFLIGKSNHFKSATKLKQEERNAFIYQKYFY